MAVSLGLGLSQGTPDEQARTTTVTARVIINYSGGSYNGNKPSGTLTVDGQTFDFSSNFNYAGIGQGPSTTGSGSTTACTKTVTVSYGTATTRTVSASASFASGTASGTVSASNSINLTAIPAYSGSGGSGDTSDPDAPPNVPLAGNASIDGQANASRYASGLNYSNDRISVVSFDDVIGVVRFKTPKFTGSSQSIDVYLSNARTTAVGNPIIMSYALCESDENYWKYIYEQDELDDPTMIEQGVLTEEEWRSMPFSIETAELEGEKYYYLIFWFSHQNMQGSTHWETNIEPIMYHQIRVNYTEAPAVSTTIWGENGAENKYAIMIDNGTGWDTYQAFIDNETKFEPYA